MKRLIRYIYNFYLRYKWIIIRIRSYYYSAIYNNIGNHNLFYGKIIVYHPELFRTGNNCIFNNNIFISCGDKIDIGNGVRISANVTILSTGLDLKSGFPYKHISKSVNIEDGVWLAAGCTILPGVRIGRNSIVAAGAVVNKDVPPSSVVAGVPAKIIKKVS